MPFGAIPLFQQDALPLLTVDQNTTGGTFQIIGGTITRVFTPADLGINGILPSPCPTSGLFYVVTPYLDLRGCSKFFMAVQVNNISAGPLTPPPFYVYAQHRNGPLDVPAIMDLQASNVAGALRAPGTAYVWSPIAAGGSARIIASWTTAALDGSGGGGAPNMNTWGQNWRFYVGTTTANPGNLDLEPYTVWMEASS